MKGYSFSLRLKSNNLKELKESIDSFLQLKMEFIKDGYEIAYFSIIETFGKHYLDARFDLKGESE